MKCRWFLELGLWRAMLTVLHLWNQECKAQSMESGPLFLAEPQTTVSFLNTKGAVISCSGHGYPQPEKTWIRQDGRPIDGFYNKDLLQVYRNGSLAFQPFSASQYDHDLHSTTYRCRLSNKYGTILSAPVKVTAHIRQDHMPPRVYDEFVIRGNTAVMKCQVPGYTNDYIQVINWLKNDQIIDIPNPPPMDAKYSLAPNGNLIIKNVYAEDENSLYKCQTKHKFQKTVQVGDQGGRLQITDTDRGVSPIINEIVPKVFVKLGEDILVPCVAQGKPPPVYSWQKKNQTGQSRILADFTLDSGSLYLPKVTFADEGSYLCKVQNSIGFDQKSVDVIVTDDLQAYILPEKQILNIGQPLRINCSTSGKPVSKISWYKNGKPLNVFGKALQIMNTSMDSIGSYQCFASNDEETVQASTSIFAGDVKPYFVSTFSGSVYSPGAQIEMQCKSRGKPSPIISWFKNYKSLNEQDAKFSIRSHVENGITVSNLKVSGIQTEDGGEYRCTASNTVGTTDHASRINVYGPPSVVPMENATAVDGEDMVIPCYVTGYPIEAIKWTKGRRKIKGRRVVMETGGRLRINKVQAAKDSGRYICTAIGPNGRKDSQSVWLKVSVKPEINKLVMKQRLKEGDSATMTCGVLRGEQPIDISWRKDGESLNYEQNIVHSKTSLSSTLQISPLRHFNEGNYTCIAKNVAGVDVWAISVIVQVPPRIEKLQTDQWGQTGSSVILNCLASGNPRPHIEWEHKEELLSDSRKYKNFENGSLLIKSLNVEEDSGLYVCLASNEVEPPANADVQLYVGDPPRVSEIEKMFSRDSKYLKFVCRIQGLSPISAKWYINELPIDNSQKFGIESNTLQNQVRSSLSLAATDLERADDVKCVATNRFGSQSQYYRPLNNGYDQPRLRTKAFEFIAKSTAHTPKAQELDPRLSEMNEAPDISERTTRSPEILEGMSQSSRKRNKNDEKVTFLQILVASVTTAVIILLFVLLLVLIVLWKKRADKRENQSQYYEAEMAMGNELDGMSTKDTIDRRYGQLRPRSARSCETLTGSGYYTTISPYATFNPSENHQEQDGQDKTLSRRLTDAQVDNF